MVSKTAALAAGILLLSALVVFSSQPEKPPSGLSAYTTSLLDRTPNQQFNAQKAASKIDGAVVPAGAVFSFNNRTGGWAASNGYRRAPVSYNGVLVDEYGGGVCQTSTTLYDAALLAGMKIIERHAHTFAPSYVPAGRDAAVAYQNVDLRFENPYNFPIILHALMKDSHLICAITGEKGLFSSVTVDTRVLDTFPAPTAPALPGAGHRRSRWHLKGRDGVRVITYRRFYDGGGELVRTELVSDNTYRGITAANWAQRS